VVATGALRCQFQLLGTNESAPHHIAPTAGPNRSATTINAQQRIRWSKGVLAHERAAQKSVSSELLDPRLVRSIPTGGTVSDLLVLASWGGDHLASVPLWWPVSPISPYPSDERRPLPAQERRAPQRPAELAALAERCGIAVEAREMTESKRELLLAVCPAVMSARRWGAQVPARSTGVPCRPVRPRLRP
jgi:hypothetical protein